MTPLDLRLAPPRPPREQLAGLVFLPRSIDKARAALPGGHLGDYAIEGFTEMMLEEIGVPLDDFMAAVRAAQSDADVAAFVGERAVPGGIEKWNAFISARLPSAGDRAAAERRYPWLAERPDIVLALDVLLHDDRLAFSPPER